jgi:predicted nucleic acid-binding protein
MIVLDTNVVSEEARERPDPAVLDWLDSVSGSDVCITAVTAAEMLAGVARLPRGRRRERLEVAVHEILMIDFAGRILPFDAAAAEHYAEVMTRRSAAGRPVGVPDAQIAAICRLHGATLATRNTKDFDGIGVEVVSPWVVG